MFRLTVTCAKCKVDQITDGRDAVAREIEKINAQGEKYLCPTCKQAFQTFKAALEAELIALKKTRIQGFYDAGGV